MPSTHVQMKDAARRRRWLIAPAALVLAAACGSTVPQTYEVTDQSGPGQQSLGVPTTATPGAAGGSSTGSSVPGTGRTSPLDGSGSAGTSTAPGNSSGSTSSAGGTTSATGGTTKAGKHAGRKATTSAPPTTPLVKTPILVGFMAAASASAAVSAIGAHNANQETPQDAFAYFVNQLNKHGGLNGRKVQVIQDFINPISSDYDVQAASACADFTQDHHVAVVFSVETSYYSQAFSGCMANAHVPELLAVTGGIAPSTLAQYPTLFSTTAPTVNRRFTALINGLSGNGYFNKKTKIGVVVEDCPFNDAAYSSTIAPMLKARGFSFTERGFGCVHGFESAATVLGQIQNLVLPMRAAGASRIMFVTGFETIAAEFFERQAHNQRYTPGYALTSTADIGDNAPGFSTDALSRVAGVGWDPDMDVTKLTANSSATKQCRALWSGYGPANDRLNHYTNEITCEEFFLMQAALQKTRGVSDAGAVEAALEGLGTSYVSPLLLAGATKYGPGDKDGPTMFATFGYQAKCQCIAYTGTPTPLA